MGQFLLRTVGNQAKLIGPIDAEIESLLQTKYHWCDELDFSNEKLFYADGICYSGICHSLAEYLKELGHEVELIFPPLSKPEYNWPFIWKYREGQEEFANTILEKRYGIGEASAGFGKTGVMIAAICKTGLPSIIIVSEKEPFDQAFQALNKIIDSKYIGRVGDGVYEPSVINVCMIQTLMSMIKQNHPFIDTVKKCKAFYIDEVHSYCGLMAWAVFDCMRQAEIIFGVSATPVPEHGRASFIEAMVGKVHIAIPYATLIDQGILCPVTFYIEKMRVQNYQINPKDSQRKRAEKYRQIVDECIVYNKERHNHIKQFVDEMLEDNISVAVICQQVEHAKSLLEVIPYATLLTGTTKKKEREDIVKKLRNKEIMCVITTVFNQAVDIPSLGAVAIVAGGKSYVKLIQRIRSTRTFSGETATGHLTKREGIVYYPYDRAPFLQNHSSQALKIFKEFCSGHKLNKIIEVN